jgi:hypothetical protein
MSIEPIPVSVESSVHVTFRQVGFERMLHPGLLTVAVNVKFSFVPTVAEAGVTEILIPVMIVNVAVSTFVVSACEVPVIVTAGSIVTTPFTVAVGIFEGAV